KLADTDPKVVGLLKECSFALFGFDPYGEFADRSRSADLRAQVKTATRLRQRLVQVLATKRHARFFAAKTAGFVFDDAGEVNTHDSWVSAMIARRDGRRPLAAA